MSDEHSVLIVEDERDLRELYRDYLAADYSVLTASSIEEAHKLLEDHVDVVLLDRRLPDGSGESILEDITDRGNTMVAMVTAVAPDLDIVDMEVDDYLTKPVFRDELLNTVEELLRVRSYNDKMNEYYAKARKQSALLDEKSDEELVDNDEFTRLVADLESLREELDEFVDGMPADDSEEMFPQII